MGDWSHVQGFAPVPPSTFSAFVWPGHELREDLRSGAELAADAEGAGADGWNVSASQEQEEAGVENQPFQAPQGPWPTFTDMVDAWQAAANLCSHRFKLCYSTCAHRCVSYAKKQGLDSEMVTDYGYFYCSCTAQGAVAAKPHLKSWCPFKIMFKLFKLENHWDVVKDHAETSFQHTCSPLPNFTVTATGLVLIREEKDLSQPETEFLNAQFACVGVTPRIIQHNFRNQFRDSRRTPSSTLVVRMRARHATSVLGVDGPDTVKKILADLDGFQSRGGVGTYEHDEQFK
jgi:hypothetical protein